MTDVPVVCLTSCSLLQVSVIGCATLLLALWSLLAPSKAGRDVFAAASPYLTLAYVIWLVDDYVATALDGIVTLSAVVHSVGVWGYSQPFPALLPLLLHLLTTVAIAGLSRHRCISHRSSNANTAAAAASFGGAGTAARQDAAHDAGSSESGLGTSTPGSVAWPGGGTAATSRPGSSSAAAWPQSSGMASSFAQMGPAGAVDVPVQGGSPPSAGRELRQLMSFSARMPYQDGELWIHCVLWFGWDIYLWAWRVSGKPLKERSPLLTPTPPSGPLAVATLRCFQSELEMWFAADNVTIALCCQVAMPCYAMLRHVLSFVAYRSAPCRQPTKAAAFMQHAGAGPPAAAAAHTTPS